MMVPVEEREYARLLGYPWGTALAGDVRERAALAAAWYTRNGNPQVYCVAIDESSGSEVVAITAGSKVDCETDRLWQEGRPDEAYFLDRYAVAVVETLARRFGPYKSPGTAGVPFEQQWTLFSYIAPLKPEIEILSSGMLKPKNSLLAMVTRDIPYHENPCTACDLAGCTFRRRSA